MRRFLVVFAMVSASMFALVPAAEAHEARDTRHRTSFNTYIVQRIVGPFSGTAKDGDPGFPESEGEADRVNCRGNDSIVSGKATILRRTVHHGLSRNIVIKLDVIGAFWDSDVDALRWGTFIAPNGKKGWNSVRLSILCHT